jgi:hypothetical protein
MSHDEIQKLRIGDFLVHTPSQTPYEVFRVVRHSSKSPRARQVKTIKARNYKDGFRVSISGNVLNEFMLSDPKVWDLIYGR